ncbi:MAG: OmpA family protein [Candidatus Ozemobacteraceae bacterium]
MIAGVALLGPITTACASETSSSADSSAKTSYEQARRFEVGPFVGYQFFEDKQNLKNSLNYGGRLGYNLTSHFGVEGSLGMVKSHVDDKSKTGAQKGQYRSPTDSVDLTFYQFDAIYQFTPERRFTPFVVAGIGSFRYSPQVLDNNATTFDYGVGAKYWMKKDVALRVDLRDQRADSFHNYNATVEVVFAFGGRSKRTPVPVVKSEPVPEPKEITVVPEETPKVEEKVESLASEPKIEGGVITLTFEDVHFNFDKSTLTEPAKAILKRTIQKLKDNPQTRVRISGYTSASGSDEYNQRLSERRANAVEKYLVNEGAISPDRLTTIGYGETNPAEHEAAPKQKYSKAAKANMRVIFETIVN